MYACKLCGLSACVVSLFNIQSLYECLNFFFMADGIGVEKSRSVIPVAGVLACVFFVFFLFGSLSILIHSNVDSEVRAASTQHDTRHKTHPNLKPNPDEQVRAQKMDGWAWEPNMNGHMIGIFVMRAINIVCLLMYSCFIHKPIHLVSWCFVHAVCWTLDCRHYQVLQIANSFQTVWPAGNWSAQHSMR